jgi:hypothetical protein
LHPELNQIEQRSKHMSKINTARIALVIGTLVVGGVAAGLSTAGAQAAPEPKRSVVATSAASPVVEQETGIVLEGSGSAGDLTASVTVYENSLHGNSVQVMLGDDLIGYYERTAAYLVGGHLEATVDVDGEPATLTGTIVPDGRPTRYVEPVQDSGEQIVTRGTHTVLAGDLTLTYAGVTVPLGIDTAFRYDLEVRKVALYGS